MEATQGHDQYQHASSLVIGPGPVCVLLWTHTYQQNISSLSNY